VTDEIPDSDRVTRAELIGGGIVGLAFFGTLMTFALAVASCSAKAAEPLSQMHLPDSVRAEYRNPDGSCVQCSIGMCGAHAGVPAAAYLLDKYEDQESGRKYPAERGGSWPSRVAEYCDRRGIQAYNVTSDDPRKTAEWAKWAAQTGRFAAVGLNRAHFQTVYGYEPGSEKPWLVVDNNSTSRIDRYTHEEFIKRHAASGPWVVILKQAAPDPPKVIEWWK
jgi:hypothetical protein